MQNKKLPPIHPGETLIEEFLKPVGISHLAIGEKEIKIKSSKI
ncbi:MAG: hypothetical protein PVH58_06910 [Desulfobacterales bacterium]|jgi:plasmid maintenance system antidote protein VapI